MKDYKAVLAEAESLAKPYSETGHLYPENELLPRPVWFKGSRDRGLRGNIVAWTYDFDIQRFVDRNRSEFASFILFTQF